MTVKFVAVDNVQKNLPITVIAYFHLHMKINQLFSFCIHIKLMGYK